MRIKALDSVPLLLPAVSLAIGIAAGALGYIALAVAAIVIAAIALLRFDSIYAACATICFSGYILGATFASDHHTISSIAEGAIMVYDGTIKDVTENPIGMSATMRVDGFGPRINSIVECRPFDIRIIVPDYNTEYHRGDRLTIMTDLETVKAHHDLPDDYDPAETMLRQGIAYRAILSPSDDIIKHIPDNGPRAKLEKAAAALRSILFSADINPETKSFLNATLLGDTSMIDPDLRATFSQAGIAHVLALSGLHTGLIAMIISFALYPLTLLRRGRATVAIISVALLWCYAMATGLSPSVTRAVIMATVYAWARLLQRRSEPLNSLCLSAIIILVVDPKALFEISFQLSFAAVIAIITFAPVLTFASPKRRWLYAISSFFAVSISAVLGTALISILYFHSLPVYFLMGNIVVAALLPPLMIAGAIVIALQSIGIDLAAASQTADALFHAISATAQWIASLPGSTIDNIYLPWWTAVPYIILLCLARLMFSKRHPGAIVATASGVIAITAIGIAFTPTRNTTPGIYTTSYRQSTNIVVIEPESSCMHIITTADSVAMKDAEQYAQMRYRDIAGQHFSKGIKIHNDTFIGRCFSYKPPLLKMESKTMAIIDSKTDLNDLNGTKLDFTLIDKGYRGDIYKIMQHCPADTLLLSADINMRRLKKLRRQCDVLSIPAVALRERSVTLHP